MRRQEASARLLSDDVAPNFVKHMQETFLQKQPGSLQARTSLYQQQRRQQQQIQAWEPGWTSLGPRSLTPCFSFGNPILATLCSLFSIRKRNVRVREKPTHTHSERNRSSEDKMALVHTAARGQRCLIRPRSSRLSS